MKQVLFYIMVTFCVLSCHDSNSRRINNTQPEPRVIDSMRICYYKWPKYVLRNPYDYHAFLYYYYSHNEYSIGQYFTIKDDSTITMISKAIDQLVVIDRSEWNDFVKTKFVLLVFSDSKIDTIAFESTPGRVQVRETKYADKFRKDSLLWYITTRLITERDSQWSID